MNANVNLFSMSCENIKCQSKYLSPIVSTNTIEVESKGLTYSFDYYGSVL